MKFLPEIFEECAVMFGWTRKQRIGLITLVYVDVALYVFLLLLAFYNICKVIPKHYKQYKMLPIPAFYVFAVFALSLRPIYTIGYWTEDPSIYYNIDWVQQGFKVCVGLAQDWITVELAMRIHTEKGGYEFSAADKNRLKAIFKPGFLALVLALTAWIIAVIVTAHQDPVGYAFGEYTC